MNKFMSLLKFIKALPKSIQFCLGIVITIILGLIDYQTGTQAGFFVFYFIPIFFITWNIGLISEIIMVFLCSLVWFIANSFGILTNTNLLLHLWNLFVRFLVFLIICYSTWNTKTQQQLKQNLSHFIIHDLRSPLSNIIMSLGVIEELNPGRKINTYVKMAKISGTRMQNLINAILDLDRLERGKMPVKLAPVNLITLVNAKEITSVWAERSGVAIKINDNINNKTITTDESLLQRVLVNIFSNAIKVSPKGSVINCELGLNQENKILVKITDQGPKIPPDKLKSIFDIYTQIEVRKAGANIGSGLGLTFCKLAIESLKGDLWLESDGQNETSVLFTLPNA
ncbi:hypothetical protein COT42_05015 [Candidatus Saganbacteria bacterium CG08_land_8_20_14_0_20_45_16]|uniref:histidine kinase n=1 Tax=Candidatus Saganbacteria bacterium CG08_land_8_20_14_0_20_45_16 TaxID=2014293 RepID=A0A2H0XXI9_UNCSA|nr:MAG: hypothetical protein COT42_05015 [Candidatus Saganbacteria bacterium CG08_land_8_20_14_0_20_45_16]